MSDMETRISLLEQRMNQIHDWIKELNEKLANIDRGVGNHLTEVAKEFGRIREETNAKFASQKTWVIAMLVGLVANLVLLILK